MNAHVDCLQREAKEAVERQEEPTTSYYYGEVSFMAMARMLRDHGDGAETFLDIGSGSGRAVIAASLLHPFKSATGIEVVKGLHVQAERAKSRLEELGQVPKCQIAFLLGDALAVAWPIADFVLLHATCFSRSLFKQLEQRLREELRPGALVAVVTKELSVDLTEFHLVGSSCQRMEWGTATVSFYRRLNPDSCPSTESPLRRWSSLTRRLPST